MAPSLFSPFFVSVFDDNGVGVGLSKKYGGRMSVKHKADKRLSFDLSELLNSLLGSNSHYPNVSL